MSKKSTFLSSAFFFLFFLLMLFEAFRLFWPFIGAIGGAIVLAIVFKPWYDLLGRWFPRLPPGKKSLLLDAMIMTLFVFPVALLIWSAVSEAQAVFPTVARELSQARGYLHQSPTQSFPWLQKLPASFTSQIDVRSAQFQDRMAEFGQNAFSFLANFGTEAAKRFVDIALNLLLMVFCLFFMFRDGEAMYGQFLELIPLSIKSKKRLSQTTQRTVVGVVRGTFLMSVAQTTMMAIGLLVVHAQAIILLSFLTFAATFIPSIGTALISVPAALYYLFVAARWKGVFLLIWGFIGMGILDNVLRPYLSGVEGEMSFFWLVFAILGGLEAFGIKGLLLGPLILSLMPVLFEIYRERYLEIPEDD